MHQTVANRTNTPCSIGCILWALAALTLNGCGTSAPQRDWLAGDHHIHSRYSVGWNRTTQPPEPIIGGDAIYPIPTNAHMAKQHGLAWMVATDHGGPNHSKINLEQAYPELERSRREVSDVIQFYGLEFNTPGADHSSVIMAHGPHESRQLHAIERRFDTRESYPLDPERDAHQKMIEALSFMSDLSRAPVVIANHPSRTASGLGVYGRDTPAELRDWNDAAPRIAVGMAGAPGHQALAINFDGSLNSVGARGAYTRYPTMGGFDQMTARLGGFWDSMLGEGRRWWITANSDSHVNWREGGVDFWPGEYSKTYVFARHTYADILAGIRNGRVFVTTGDLVSAANVSAETSYQDGGAASIGGTLNIARGSDVLITINIRDPDALNHHGDAPRVTRVDLIVGSITGPLTDRNADTNPTTRVERRFDASHWIREGEYLTMITLLKNVQKDLYLRVRGTNTQQLEPEVDPRGDDPWQDLWFYTNPIFLEVNDPR